VKKLLKFFTNKYAITAILFLLLMLFFDQNDWFTQHARVKELEKTQEKINHLNGEISRMDTELRDLNSSNAQIEKYAREKYHEKQEGEDVYIIVPDTVGVRK